MGEVGQDGCTFGAQPTPRIGGAPEEKVHAIRASHHSERSCLRVDGVLPCRRAQLEVEVTGKRGSSSRGGDEKYVRSHSNEPRGEDFVLCLTGLLGLWHH